MLPGQGGEACCQTIKIRGSRWEELGRLTAERGDGGIDGLDEDALAVYLQQARTSGVIHAV